MSPSRQSKSIVAFFAFFVACFLSLGVCAQANDPGTPPGSTQPAPAPAPPEPTSTQKPAARREDIEPKNLNDALAALKKARGERDQADTDLAAEQTSHEKTKGLLRTTLETCKTAQKDRDTALADAKANKEGWDAEKTAHGKTKEQNGLLEAALQVKGTPTSDLVPAALEPKAKMTIADFDKRLNAAKTPQESAAITKEFEKALADGLIA